MERFQNINKWLPVTQDWLELQARKADAIRKRITDARSWGILHNNAFPTVLNIPASATNPAPNLKYAIQEFPINFDTELGRINIGVGSDSAGSPPVFGGVGYDLNGERIGIPDDINFDFDNSIPEGTRSSGNIGIPLTLTGTSGGCDTNPSVLGTYYV